MNKWLAVPDETKKRAYSQVAEKIGMAPFAVEKDWWVVQTLALISEMDVAPYLIFKGGTSLSKAWNIIQRFSEDIDLALDREFLGFSGHLSKNQRTKMRKASGKYVDETFYRELADKFNSNGFSQVSVELEEVPESDKDRKINIYYPFVVETPGYIRHRVQIEIGCRSLKEPFLPQTFSSLLDEGYPDADFAHPPVTFPTATPERTFLEKLFLLHEEFQRPKEKIRVDRMSRHLYDIAKLSRTPFAEKAFTDQALWETIVQHRYEFTRVGGVNYNLHQPATIDPLPVPEVVKEWKSDYTAMRLQMIYEENPPTFDELIAELIVLRDKIRTLPWAIGPYFPVP